MIDMRRFKFLKIAMMVIIIFSLVSGIVMFLWNWLMPELFGLPVITFWKAAGLLLLSKILFGGFKKSHNGPNGPPWKKHWQEKWQNIPEEKREKWKQRFADKWCGPAHETKLDTEEEQKEGH